MILEDSLMRVVERWLCGRCMSIHVMSRECHHLDGLFCVTHGTGEVISHIVDIVKPSTTYWNNLETNEEYVLDVRLLERVLTSPIFIMKSIPLMCRLTLSQALKDTFYKVLIELRSVGVWVWLLLIPCCILQVVKPHNVQDYRFGN